MVAKKKPAKKAVAKKTVAKKTAPKKTKKAVAKKTVVAPKISAAPKIGGWWGNSFTGAGVLITVAAFMGIIAFFCTWLSHDLAVKEAFTGLDLAVLDAKADWFGENVWQVYIPVITFVVSIVAFIAIILPAFKIRTNKIGVDALVIVCGIVILILTLCFLFGEINNEFVSGQQFMKSIDVGFYMTLIAGIVMILAGLRDATKRY